MKPKSKIIASGIIGIAAVLTASHAQDGAWVPLLAGGCLIYVVWRHW